MSMSGIEVDPNIAILFNEMKLRSTHKYATFKIENKKKIVEDVLSDPVSTASREEDKAEFDKLKSLITSSNEPRYILYDFSFPMTKDNRSIKKIAFIFWCPDDSKIGDKMIYASSKDSIKKSFSGLSLEFQANDKADFDYNTLADEVERKA
ncbi:uncharacterized protein [Dysidea avara]|uniref:uncharacterized protein n=1 Tax=Dysidea avara TaxID=196820 RepID=UPI00331EDE9F